MGTCKDCKWWHKVDGSPEAANAFQLCSHFALQYEGRGDKEAVNRELWLFYTDYDCKTHLGGGFYTLKDFGCVLFEKRE